MTKQPQEPSMDRMRAAVCFFNSTTRIGWNNKAREYFFHLTFFHPNITLAKRIKMAGEMANNEGINI